jgi:hypothetical protein
MEDAEFDLILGKEVKDEKLKEVSITYHSSVPFYDHFCTVSNKKFKMNGEEVGKIKA